MFYYCRPSPEDVQELDQLKTEIHDPDRELELYGEIVKRQNVNLRLCAVCGMEDWQDEGKWHLRSLGNRDLRMYQMPQYEKDEFDEKFDGDLKSLQKWFHVVKVEDGDDVERY